MFFRHAFDQPLIKRLAGVEVIQQVLVVLYRRSIFPAPDDRFREGSAVADDALRLNLIQNDLERLLITRKAVGLIDDT